MKFSFIVPVYNGEKYLRRCIDSILSQTCGDYEICLIDDGSVDKSARICDEYAAAYDNIRVKHVENGGVSAARNIGIDMASGSHICFVDCDDEVSPKLLFAAQKMPPDTDLALFGYTKSSEKELSFGDISDFKCISDKRELFIKTIYDDGKRLAGVNCFTVWAKIYKKSAIGGAVFREDIKIGEDRLFNFEVFQNCKNILFCGDIMYYCRTHPSSVTSSYADGYFKSGAKASDLLRSMIGNIAAEEDKRLYLSYLPLRTVVILKVALVLDLCSKSNKKSYRQRRREYYEMISSVAESLRECEKDRLTKSDAFYLSLFKRSFFSVNAVIKYRPIKGTAFLLYMIFSDRQGR